MTCIIDDLRSFMAYSIPTDNVLVLLALKSRLVSQVDGRPPVLTATSQSNGNGQTLTTHRIQTP